MPLAQAEQRVGQVRRAGKPFSVRLRGHRRPALLATLLIFLNHTAAAEDSASTAHWAIDPISQCALFDATLRPGDTVSWTGACEDGRAEGSGTATFSNAGSVFESFSGDFSGGTAADGTATIRWGKGWSYDGELLHGRFDGEGILINDKGDQFSGWWKDGKLDGAGSVIHANGERYDGDWKDDLPNGHGVLIQADGNRLEGEFQDGKYATPVSDSPETPVPSTPVQPTSALAELSGKRLVAVDGADLALAAIEGGIQRNITGANGSVDKTTFTFINERLGTVAADGKNGAANVTGFFRLTDNGVEVRYADGRSEILSADADGGVLLRLETPGASPTCRSFYPEGHSFSEAEKKAAVAEYASRLGLTPSNTQISCPDALAGTTPPVPDSPHPQRHAEAVIRHPAHFVAAKDQIGTLAPVTVKDSVVHAIDAMPPLPVAMQDGPIAAPGSAIADATPQDASHCLKVESDGSHWGFRNACNFDVQFAYCLAAGGNNLTGCEAGGVEGSVASGGFGALLADKSFSETDAEHDFRWMACGGGAGEVVAHLDHADPPGGRCLRAGDLAMEDRANAEKEEK